MTKKEMWTTERVAQELGVKQSSARSWLVRKKITPEARDPGRTGQNLYDPETIRQAKRGRR